MPRWPLLLAPNGPPNPWGYFHPKDERENQLSASRKEWCHSAIRPWLIIWGLALFLTKLSLRRPSLRLRRVFVALGFRFKYISSAFDARHSSEHYRYKSGQACPRTRAAGEKGCVGTCPEPWNALRPLVPATFCFIFGNSGWTNRRGLEKSLCLTSLETTELRTFLRMLGFQVPEWRLGVTTQSLLQLWPWLWLWPELEKTIPGGIAAGPVIAGAQREVKTGATEHLQKQGMPVSALWPYPWSQHDPPELGVGGAAKARDGLIAALSSCGLISVVKQRGWEHVLRRMIHNAGWVPRAEKQANGAPVRRIRPFPLL